LINYYSDQASKTEFYTKLFEQFKTGVTPNSAVSIPAVNASEPGKNLLDLYRNVVNVSLPYVDAEYYNGLILDRDAARIMSAGIDAVRVEWNRSNSEIKRNMIKNRLNQYQQNIGARRNVKFGVSGTELKERITWEKRQHEISGYLFSSLMKSCSLNAKTLQEAVVINPNVSVIDISPLAINAKIINNNAFDSDLACGIENMAEVLPQVMIELFNGEIEHTIKQEMDILRRNGADWSKFRYEIGNRIGLTMANLAETGKSVWAKIRSKEYQKKNLETGLYCYYMMRDFNLEEKLVKDLYWAQKTQEDAYNALVNDFIDCSLGNDGNCLITGLVDMEKIMNSNKMAIEYINDVFPLLLNTETNVRFVEKDSVENLWGPVIMLEILVGFIPGVGLAADMLIGVCIDTTACLIEKGLKQEEYAARIAEIVTIEEQKLLQTINRYGGNKRKKRRYLLLFLSVWSQFKAPWPKV
jgi:hypothetical protein